MERYYLRVGCGRHIAHSCMRQRNKLHFFSSLLRLDDNA